MQIACPKCSASYSIDPRLVPAGGASVQCTSCRHVFKALGSGDGAAAPPPPRSSTTMMGAVTAPPPQTDPAPPRSSTTMMGAVTAPTPPTPTPPRSSTTMMGAVSGPVAPAGSSAAPVPPRASTTVMGAVELPSAAVPPEPQRTSTQMMGAVGASNAPAQTLTFGREQALPSKGSTAVFGREQLQDAQVAGQSPAWADSVASLGAAQNVSAGRSSTQLFSGVGAGPASRVSAAMGGAGPGEGLGAAIPPGRAVASPLQLPGEGKPQRGGAFPIDLSTEVGGGDETSQLEQGLRRRQWLQWGAALLVLALAGGLAYHFVSGRRPEISNQALAERDVAVTALRRDDTASLETAADQFQALYTKVPALLEAHAYEVIALAFQLDDLRLDTKRIERDQTQLKTEINRLRERKSPGDWSNRVNALNEEVQTLESRRAPLLEKVLKLDERLNSSFQALNARTAMTLEDEAAQLRAQAIYYGAKGADQALGFTERYRALGLKDGWADVAYAEYVLNGRVAPASLAKARESLEPLRTADSAFIRPHVLVSRLALATDELEVAGSTLELVLGFNPKHTVAERLRAEVRARQDARTNVLPEVAPPPADDTTSNEGAPASPSATPLPSPDTGGTGGASLQDAIQRAASSPEPQPSPIVVEGGPEGAEVDAAATEPEPSDPTSATPAGEATPAPEAAAEP